MKTIDDIIKEYFWHSPVDRNDTRKMLLEAQIAVLETLEDGGVGQCIGGELKSVIFKSEVSEKISDLKNELRVL